MQYLIRAYRRWEYKVALWVMVAALFSLHQAEAHSPAPTFRQSVQETKLLHKAKQQVLQARQQHDTLPWRRAHIAAGKACQDLWRHESAVYHFRRAVQLSGKNAQAQASALQLLGSALHSQGDTGKSRQVYQRALLAYGQLQSLAGKGEIYEKLGELYGSANKWPQAQISHEQALQVWKQLHDSARMATALNDIGMAHQRQQHRSLALYYLQQALAQAQRLHDSTRTGETLRSTGQVYQELGNYEVAASLFTKALQSLPASAPAATRANTLWVLATMQDSVGQSVAAKSYLKQALKAARESGSKVLLRAIYFSLSDLEQRHGQPAAALQALRQYTALQDSAYAEQRAAQIADLQLRYETEKKEREIELLTKDQQLQQANLRRQKLLRNLLGAGALLLLLTVGALYRGRKQQVRINRLLQRQNAAISRQKEALDRLNQTKDTLFSVISHDLRSPLSSLYSLLSLLSLGTLPPARLAAHTERLSRTLDSTLRLLDNLLNWSSAQMQGESGAKPERIRLDILIEEALNLLAGDAERKQLHVVSDVQELLVARADLNMTRLVLRNLLGNALKFTPAGGTITISARRLNSMWEISVHDTGVGIAPAVHDKVLGQRGTHTTLGTAQEKGTGLGLRLCKDFVERNGGLLSFESAVGQGSTFRFTLPVSEGALPMMPFQVVRSQEDEAPAPGETTAEASAAAG
ncbi:Signal transduction histidine kinase [Hymenobacter gelipurpurascens]|uniref:histidine kinase n=1 Tax=Hymenobacter gelipurpurascens TaxID=89968 RepID=A0A212TLE6_9BACT|nr:tetratricopeptide repeat-containing sensor histidine kinase [Hymenobacter gelipurpurascens]SNC66879.1 Signal transduction histidine kinase [Hymenobacter gelipurpurascens]